MTDRPLPPLPSSFTRRGLLAASTLAPAAALGAAPAVAAPAEQDRSSHSTEDGGSEGSPEAGAAAVPGAPERARRAIAATASLLEHFSAEDDADMLIEQHPRAEGDPEFSYVWPLSQARAAVTELAVALEDGPPADTGGLDLDAEAESLLRAQERYWYPEGGTTGLPGYTAASDSEQGAHGDFYYDDNDWIALIEIEQHLVSGGAAGDLERAQQLLELFRSGESTDPTLASPGGIEWTQGENADRNTVSTFPSAKVALRIFELTGDESALEDAQRWMDWGRGTLLSPEGLFWDNIKPDGEIDRTFWSYNQGVPLGTEILALQLTGNRVHRRNALDLIDAIHEHYRPLEAGPLDDEPIQFAAIMMSNLLLAESELGARVHGRRSAEAYAQRLWENRRDPETDLVIGSRESEDGTHLLDQAGFARALALAIMPRSRWSQLC